jgi:hypothetical protein
MMKASLVRRLFGSGFIAVTVLLAFVRCTGSTDPDDGAACHAGDRLQCTCGSGALGLMSCVSGELGACDCSITSADGGADASGDGGHEGGISTSDAGFGRYLGPCTVTSDCPTGGICFMFGTKGNVCTHTCEASIECAAPSPKCNPKSVCAPPD